MRCISPISIKNPNLIKRQKIPTIAVVCGRCNNCLRKKANDKTFQLAIAENNALSAYFITLTYNDTELYKQQEGIMENYPEVNARDVQLFLKKLRKYQNKIYPNSPKIKYYAVSEYSPIGRPHYHIIMFNLQLEPKNQLDKIWAKGHVHIGDVTKQSINYVTHYVFEKRENKPLNEYYQRKNEFSLSSINLGEEYLQNKKYHVDNKTFLALVNGHTYSLPKYYKDKMFTQNEKNTINKKYEALSELQREKEIKKLIKLGYENPEYALETRLFHAENRLTNKKHKIQ